MPVASIIIAFVVPALAALVIFIIADRPWRANRNELEHDQPPGVRHDRTNAISLPGAWGGAWATAIGFAIGYWMIEREVMLWPDGNLHWLPHAALFAAVLAQIACLLPKRWRSGWLVRSVLGVLLAGATAVIVRAPQFDDIWTVLLAGSVLLAWLTVDWCAWRAPGAGLPIVALPAGIGASLVIMWAGEEQLARATGNAAAIAGAGLIVAWWPGRTRPLATMTGMPAAMTVVLVGPLLMAKAYTFSDIPWLSYLAPIIAVPAGLWFGEIPFMRRRSPWLTAAARLIAACLVTAIGVYLAWRVTDTSIY